MYPSVKASSNGSYRQTIKLHVRILLPMAWRGHASIAIQFANTSIR
jgi:hypothetical protein